MRIPISLFTIALSCVLSQAASINWTNHVANIQAETNGYFGTSVNVGAGFADARLYPDSGPAVTPFRLQSTALRLAGNIFEVSNGPGFLILSLDYTGLLSAPDLLLTGDASVQGAVLTDNVVATNGVVTGGLTNTSVSQLRGAVTANQITSTNSATFQAGFTSDSGTITNTLTVKGDAEVQGTVRAGGLVSTNAATVNNLVATNGVYTGGQTNTGVTVRTPSAIQTLAAGTVIAWDSSTERVAGSGGAVTLTGTPTIQTNNVPDGALITILGTSDANTVTLQDYRLLTGTCISMEMGLVTLKNGSEIRFQWSASNQKWQQIAFSANSSQTHVFANLTVQTNLVVTNSISCAGAITTTSGGSVNVAGNVNGSGAVRAGTSSQIYWNLRSQMIAPGDGAIAIKNNGGGSYGNLWLRNIEFSEFETLSDVAPSSVALNLTNAYYKIITLTNDTTFTVSNAALGRGCAVWITCDASPHNITLPAWHVLNVAAPASIAANKVAVISILYKDGTDANAIATISVEP